MVRSRGTFARNALVTFSGVVLTTLTQLILTPLVARLYGPDAYGTYGLFLALMSNLFMIGGMGYTYAFVIPDKETDFHGLMRATVIGTVMLAVLITPICLFPGWLYTLVPSWSILGPWLALLPLAVLVHGVGQALEFWSIRAKAFTANASISTANGLITRLFFALHGWLVNTGVQGLMLGEVLVRIGVNAAYLRVLRAHGLRELVRPFTWASVRHLMAEYRTYPLFVLPSRMISLFAMQLPIFLFAAMGEVAAMGHFALAGSLLVIPLRMFGYSMSSVFLHKAAETVRERPEDLGRITAKLFKRMLTLGLLPFAVLTLFGDHVFRIVLGDDWTAAGVFAAFMGPFFLFRLLSEPISSVYNVLDRNRQLFSFHLVLLILRALLMGGVILAGGGSLEVLVAFAAISTLAYLHLSGRILQHAGLGAFRRLGLGIGAFLLLCVALSFLRHALFGTWWVL